MSGAAEEKGAVDKKALHVERIPRDKRISVKTGATIKVTKKKRKFLFSY